MGSHSDARVAARAWFESLPVSAWKRFWAQRLAWPRCLQNTPARCHEIMRGMGRLVPFCLCCVDAFGGGVEVVQVGEEEKSSFGSAKPNVVVTAAALATPRQEGTSGSRLERHNPADTGCLVPGYTLPSSVAMIQRA